MSLTDSIFFKPAAIAILANEKALDDLSLFLDTLTLWTPTDQPTLYIYCTQAVDLWLRIWKEKYNGSIVTKVALDEYKDYTRKDMELMKSKRGLSNLFHDFTQEKCDLVEWALQNLSEEDTPRGVLFCDADILWLSGIPSIHRRKTLGLSPHMIRKHDEDLYGVYNAGFLWTNNPAIPSVWREACKHSRFFEQAALEEVRARTPDDEVVEFDAQVNYGWWRLYQSSTPLEDQKKRWSIFRNTSGLNSGLCLDGQPVCCIHTHWKTTDFATQSFNKFIAEKLKLLSSSQPKVRKLLSLLNVKY